MSVAAIAAAELADHDRSAQFSFGEIVGRVDQRIAQADKELIAVLQHVAPQPIVVSDAHRAIEHPVDLELDRRNAGGAWRLRVQLGGREARSPLEATA